MRTQVTFHGLLDVDSVRELLLDLLVLLLHLLCTCTCTCTCRLGRQAGGRTRAYYGPKHARRFASATVEFQAGVCSTDDVQTSTSKVRLLRLSADTLT